MAALKGAAFRVKKPDALDSVRAPLGLSTRVGSRAAAAYRCHHTHCLCTNATKRRGFALTHGGGAMALRSRLPPRATIPPAMRLPQLRQRLRDLGAAPCHE